MKTKPLRKVYRLKVTLVDSEPPIWRRLLVPGTVSLKKFHRILQVVMGWTDTHLHQFLINDEYYGEPDPDFDDDIVDESRVRLNRLLNQENDSLIYEYDSGDGWDHEIVLERVLPFSDDAKLQPRREVNEGLGHL